jgi:NAD(P)H dehydrogenase (quinone)
MNRTLLVFAHPRRDSLTGQVADRMAQGLAAGGVAVEWADLIAEGFDPVMRQGDEPDWDDPDKIYPPDALREMERVRRNDATVMVFPVYSWSVPAILKGWIDRVWNYGFAYGPRKYPQRRVWMIGVAGNTREDFAKRGYDEAMRVSLDVGTLDYCGVADRRLELLFGATEGAQYPPQILQRAEQLAQEFCGPPSVRK